MSRFDSEEFDRMFKLNEEDDIYEDIPVDDPEEDNLPIAKEKVFVTAPVDRSGRCPCCNENWDGGDILEQLSKLDIFFMIPKEAKKMAEKYGWTEWEKKRFSNVIGVEFEKHLQKTNMVQCPKCRHVFNVVTGQHFRSLNEARNNLYE
jgi:hypothetical protein